MTISQLELPSAPRATKVPQENKAKNLDHRSVHHGGFPEVSDNSTLSENNTNGGINFDSTRGIFDTLVVEEYLEGTGQRGGPLVTSFNETSRSDLRLFESDGNATMKALYAQGEGFIDTCVDLLTRAINTVPAGVDLQDAVEPMAIKPVNVTWDIAEGGGLELSGRIRVCAWDILLMILMPHS